MPNGDSKSVDLNDSQDLTLTTVVRLLADEPKKRSNPTELAPTRGRVIEESDSNKVYIGDGNQWLDISSAVGMSSPSLSTERININGTLVQDEDGNSPYTANENTPVTFSLDGEYQLITIFFSPWETDKNTTIELRVNGDTGNNYDHDEGNGDTEWVIGFLGGGPNSGIVTLDGRGDDTLGTGYHSQLHSSTTAPIGGVNKNVTAPITQFTLGLGGFSTSRPVPDFRVYGREI